mgnify:CR=1 FL=1
MKKKMPTPIKDGLVGLAFGIGAIIPGIAGGTILLVAGVYKKVVNAVANLFSKNFFRNFIILLPFGIGALLAVAALVIPLNLAMEYVMFAIVCLFAGLIIGSLPSVTDKVKDKPRKKRYAISFLVFFVLTALIGVFSVIFNTNPMIETWFEEIPNYLYLIIFGVGFVSAAGLIVPGFSGSMLLLVLCFYQPILNLFKFENIGVSFGLLGCFAVGALLGFVVFSKIMNHYLKSHSTGTYYASIGMIVGSLVAVFVNSKMFDYINNSGHFDLVDQIGGPILLILGITAGYIFVRYVRNHPEFEEDAKN